MSSSAKRWVTSCSGCNRFDSTVLRSIGVLTVSTRRVVIVTLRDQSSSRWRSTFVPCTPTLATIGRAHVGTPVTNAHLVWRLVPEEKKRNKSQSRQKIDIKEQTHNQPRKSMTSNKKCTNMLHDRV